MIVERMDFIDKYDEDEWKDNGGYDEYRQQADIDYSGDYELTDDDEKSCIKMLIEVLGTTPQWLFTTLKKEGLDSEKVEEGLSALGVKIVYIPNKILDFYDESITSIDPADVDGWTKINGGELVIVEQDNYEYINMQDNALRSGRNGYKPYTHYIEAKEDAVLNSKSYSDFKEKLNQIEEHSYY